MPLYVRPTKQALIDQARRELLDPNSKFWSDTELGGYVDQWQDRVQDQHELVWATSTSTLTASQTSLALPSNMLRVDAVYWNNVRLYQKTVEELNIRHREWRLSSGSTRPLVYYQPEGTGTIFFWPVGGTVGTAVLEYPKVLAFSTLTSTAELPAWARFTASDYVLFRAHLRHGPNQDINKALRYKAAWLRGIESLGSFKANYLLTRPLNLRPITQYERDILEPHGSLGDPVMPSLTVAVSFADQVPVGTIDGVTLQFTLTNAPNPATSLRLYKNGVLLTANTHYTLLGSTITYISPFQPTTGDDHFASYRYTS